VTTINEHDLDSVVHWHFAVGGIQTHQDTLELGGAIRLQRLPTFPSHAELVFALNKLPVAGAIAHYGEGLIQHELVIDAEQIDDVRLVPPTANAILAGLRIATGAELICPAACEKSWAALRNVTGNSCRAWTVEHALMTHQFNDAVLVTQDDIEWVRNNLGKLTQLTDNKRFRTALDALCTYLHAGNHLMMTAQLWAGIEALFGVRFEIGYRLSVQAARYLEPRGPACKNLFKKLRKLWKVRGETLHGEDTALAENVTELRSILSRLLKHMIELGKVPDDDDFEELIFMPDPAAPNSDAPPNTALPTK
jgi:hypothetical protein